MKTLSIFSLFAALALFASSAFAVHSVYIVNSSFEAPTNINDNIGFTNIWGWNQSNGRSGLNPTASGWGAYADSGIRPDKRQVTFLNTEGGGTLDISQTLNGLDTTKEYNLQFWHNARFWTNDINTNVCIFTVHYGSQLLAQITNSAVGWSDPYHFENIRFTPETTSGDLIFRNHLLASNIFSTLALDAVCLFYTDDPNALVVRNPGFEASGEQGPGGGGTGIINVSPDWMTAYWDYIAGWEYWDGGYNSAKFGVGTNSNPYFSGSPVPEGNNAFFDNKDEMWYINSEKQTQLRQLIEGFEIGEDYILSFSYNGRPESEFAPGSWVRNASNFMVKAGNIQLLHEDVLEWTPEFITTNIMFTANWTSMELIFGTSNSPTVSATMCLDDIEVSLVPEPVLTTLLALSVIGLAFMRRQ